MEPTEPKDTKDPDQEPKGEDSSIQDKFNKKIDDIQKSENYKKIVDFARSNTYDTAAYVALIIGLILLVFFNNFWGGLIIGAVTGFYFASPIISWIKGFQEYFEANGPVRTIILLGLALAILIYAAPFFLGLAIAVGIMFLVAGEKKS